MVYLLQLQAYNYRNASQQISRYLNENGENISYQEIYGKNIIAIKTLHEFCKSNVLDFEIFRGERKDEQSALMERDYLKYLEFGHNYVYRTSELDTYQYLDQAKYVITHGSTLGHEMLSRGRAVFFGVFSVVSVEIPFLGIASLVTPSFGPMGSIQFCSAHGYRLYFLFRF